MKPRPRTLKDIKVYQDIHSVLSRFVPDRFIAVLYEHMRDNKEDGFNHVYLRNSLMVVRKLIANTRGLNLNDLKLLYCTVALIESGRPLSKDKPYELSPGVSWLLLELHAKGRFSKDELSFISKNAKPLKPQTLRPSHHVVLQLLIHNTKQLTDVVNYQYQKLYDIFMEGRATQKTDKDPHQQFLDYYGAQGALWEAISDSAKLVYQSEISKFKRELESAVTRKL